MSDLASPVHMGRRVDASAMASATLYLPNIVYSLVIMLIVSGIVGGVGAWVVIPVWLASGVALVVYRPAEILLARFLLRLRHPLNDELAKIAPVWQAVTAAAGIDPGRYVLMVDRSDELNAAAFAGHIVAVTRTALDDLSPEQLAGVLAHELGHHVRGHAAVSLMAYWYAMPGRLVNAVFGFFFRFALAVAGFFADIDTDGAVTLMLLPFLLFSMLFATFVGLFTAVLAVPQAFASRRAELNADRVAAQLGFGQQLKSGLQVIGELERRAQEKEDAGRRKSRRGRNLRRRRRTLLARVYASHPPTDSRIRKLEQLGV